MTILHGLKRKIAALGHDAPQPLEQSAEHYAADDEPNGASISSTP